MSATFVHLVRHGEVHNPAGLLYGRLPGYRLSDLGETMAQDVANWLGEQPTALDRVVASPLLRAQQTAAPAAAAFGLPVRIDPRLLEAGSRIEGHRADIGTFLRPDRWALLRNPWRPSWGEPYERIAQRMWLAVIAAAREAPGGRSMLVSHQLPIWVIRSYLSGQHLWHDPRSRQCSLASVTTLEFQGEQLTAIRYDEPAAGRTATDVVA